MSTVAIVWLVVALLTMTVTVVMAVALIRHAIVLGRAVGRFSNEVAPIAQGIGVQAGRASSRAARPSHDEPARAPEGPAVR